jgi:hypothetical protein
MSRIPLGGIQFPSSAVWPKGFDIVSSAILSINQSCTAFLNSSNYLITALRKNKSH